VIQNLRKTSTIRLTARGKAFTASARFLTDQAQLGKVLEKFRDKYGRNVKSSYRSGRCGLQLFADVRVVLARRLYRPLVFVTVCCQSSILLSLLLSTQTSL